ncbi:Uncharacterized protein pbN1_32220 [Aromatoleum bremense]|nr:Uncharacterized protein pbN1_32220 [Aromatoleum bremense]
MHIECESCEPLPGLSHDSHGFALARSHMAQGFSRNSHDS